MRSLYRLIPLIVACCLLWSSGVAVAAPGAPAAPLNMELVTRLGGSSVAVAYAGDRAYLGLGRSLVVLDVSDPAQPTLLGRSAPLPYAPQDITVFGNYAYVAAGPDGLRVLDISDPTQPTEVASLDTPAQARGVVVALHPTEGIAYAYVNDYGGALRIIRVSDPTQPVEVGHFGYYSANKAVAVSGHYAYHIEGSDKLQVINISDPAQPALVSTFTSGPSSYASIQAIAAPGPLGNGKEYVYLATDYYLNIVDVTDPAHPTAEAAVRQQGVGCGIAVHGQRVYLATFPSYHWTEKRYVNGGLEVWDAADPANPNYLGFLDTPGWAYDLALDPEGGPTAYLAERDTGLRVLDAADPTAMAEVGHYRSIGTPIDIAPVGDLTYLVTPTGGLHILDSSAPTSPVELGYAPLEGYAQAVAVSSDYAYVATYYQGLRILSTSVPTAPVEIGVWDEVQGLTDVTVALHTGDGVAYAYVAAPEDSLRILSLADPTQPVQVGSGAWGVFGATVVGNTAYLASGQSGLRLLDVTNPAQPTEITRLPLPGHAYRVAVVGQYVYVACKAVTGPSGPQGGGLVIVDVSDPAHPVVVKLLPMSTSVNDIAVAEHPTDGLRYTYLAKGLSGYPQYAGAKGHAQVISLYDPGNARQVGYYDTQEPAWSVALVGDYVYVGSDIEGLTVLRFSPPPPPRYTFLPLLRGRSGGSRSLNRR